jgi:hypothetical protein
MLCAEGATSVLSPADDIAPVGPTINNRGQVAWEYHLDYNGHHGIQRWENGVTTQFTAWGGGPQLNNKGDMFFHRWYEAENTYQAWLYRGGRLYQLSSDPDWFWNIDGCVNDAGEAVWMAGRFIDFQTDLRYLRRIPPRHGEAGGLVDPVSIHAVSP